MCALLCARCHLDEHEEEEEDDAEKTTKNSSPYGKIWRNDRMIIKTHQQ